MAQLRSSDRERRVFGLGTKTLLLFGTALTAALLAALDPLPPAAPAAQEKGKAKEPAVGDLLTQEVVRVSDEEARGPVEVSVAINPTRPDHVVAVSLQAGRPGQRGTSNYVYVSEDGGRKWKTVAAANPNRRTQGDDAVTFGADGLAVRTYLSAEGIRAPRPVRASSGIFASTSRDGLAWSDPVPVVDHVNSVAPLEDKPWVRTDNAADSPHKGNIYVSWTRFDVYGSKDPEHKSHVYFSRSRDGGKSFSVPHRISDSPGDCVDSSKTVMGAVPAVGPKGEVYVVWAGPQGLVLDRSADGGWTFGKDQVIGDTPGGWDFSVKGIGRCNGLPVTGVDRSPGPDRGTVYVNWADLRHGDPDVFVRASRDGGATWGEPVRANDDPKGNGKEQFFTWMAVDPLDGSVNVVFYDRRDHDGALTGLTLARSVDGGRTFVNHRVSQEPFACERKGFFGDYLGIDAYGGRVVALYQHYTEKKQLVLSAALFQFKTWAQPPGPEKKPDAEQPPKQKDLEVPDLRELLARPQSEMRGVVQRYEADRGCLSRSYTIPTSPTRYARLKQFHTDWLTALEKLDAAKLSPEAREDYQRLQDSVRRELRQLDSQAQAQAEVAALVPFAPTIINLEEARRRMEKVDAAGAAGLLTDLRKQIEQTRKAVGAGLKVTKTQAGRAADTTASLRTTLKSWFGFYDGYDPLFTWWMAEPYKQVDQALEGYAVFLREKVAAAGEETADADPKPKEAAPVPAPLAKEPDVPDLRELLSSPQSELRGVLQRYQADRGSRGRLASASLPPAAPPSPERQARMKKFHTDWLAALQKLDFDKLSRDGQVDYLLLRNQIERELRRLDLPPRAPEEKAGKPGGESGIVGRPIGREALLGELAGEMIPYTPEELIAIADKEYAWCEAEMMKASRDMGFGNDWHKALEKVKTLHVEPGKQPELIRDLAREAIDYLRKHDLVTVPALAAETWRMEMMSPQRQLVNPFFTGGETISVSFPTSAMAHEAKLQSMRGNNVHFARATVHHELIPGHHLQGFMTARHRTHRGSFGTPFWTEGWALYWEMVLYDLGFPRTPEDRVGFLFWRMHRCARITFSLSFHLGKMSPDECIDYLVRRVGHERDNATAEVRRSFATSYGPLYQAAYMLGGLQIRALRKELVEAGKMAERDFHDAILKENRMPIALVRAALNRQKLTPDWKADWRFCDPMPKE